MTFSLISYGAQIWGQPLTIKKVIDPLSFNDTIGKSCSITPTTITFSEISIVDYDYGSVSFFVDCSTLQVCTNNIKVNQLISSIESGTDDPCLGYETLDTHNTYTCDEDGVMALYTLSKSCVDWKEINQYFDLIDNFYLISDRNRYVINDFDDYLQLPSQVSNDIRASIKTTFYHYYYIVKPNNTACDLVGKNAIGLWGDLISEVAKESISINKTKYFDLLNVTSCSYYDNVNPTMSQDALKIISYAGGFSGTAIGILSTILLLFTASGKVKEEIKKSINHNKEIEL